MCQDFQKLLKLVAPYGERKFAGRSNPKMRALPIAMSE